MEKPEQRPEGRLIAVALKRSKLSARKAAGLAGMSDGRWGQIVRGYQTMGNEVYAPVQAPADTLARMAKVVGVTPEQLEEVGRPDAAEELRSMREAPPQLGDDFDERIARIRQNPAARQRLLDLLRAARLPEADEDDQRDRRSDAG